MFSDIFEKDYGTSNTLEKIVLEIQNNPGIRFLELTRICQIPKSTMAYHISKIEKLGTIKIRKKNKECRFFPLWINQNEEPVIIALRKRSYNEILLLLQRKPYLFSDICKDTGFAQSTISEKLNSLVRQGIVEGRLRNGKKMFEIKNTNKTLEIVKRYQNFIKITEP